MLSTTQPTVAEIAAKSLAAVRVFERNGIDYCCGGHRPLAEVCEAKGLDPVSLEWELQEAMYGRPADERDWAIAPLPQLIRQIVDVHHAYLRRELPAIAVRLEKVYRVYNQRYGPALIGLPEAFQTLDATLRVHLEKEEQELFPAIEACVKSTGAAPGGICPKLSEPGLLDALRTEHEEAGELLARIRAITAEFSIPDYACVTYRALMSGLRELEQDLHLHIHLENNILFPRALQHPASRN